LGAAEELAKEGVNAEVIDLRTIRPLDHTTILKSVRKTNRLVVVDENWPFGSVASEIAYRVQKDAFDHLDAPVLRVCQADTPLPFTPSLIDASLPSVERVVRAVKEALYLVK
jgi:pyruvate dehydrogenase E1 component beta subunit